MFATLKAFLPLTLIFCLLSILLGAEAWSFGGGKKKRGKMAIPMFNDDSAAAQDVVLEVSNSLTATLAVSYVFKKGDPSLCRGFDFKEVDLVFNQVASWSWARQFWGDPQAVFQLYFRSNNDQHLDLPVYRNRTLRIHSEIVGKVQGRGDCRYSLSEINLLVEPGYIGAYYDFLVTPLAYVIAVADHSGESDSRAEQVLNCGVVTGGYKSDTAICREKKLSLPLGEKLRLRVSHVLSNEDALKLYQASAAQNPN